MVALLVLLTIITCLTIDHIVQKRSLAAALAAAGRVPMDVVSAGPARPRGLLDVPAGAFLAPGHTWLRLEPAGTVRIGTAQLPLTALGGVDGLELPAPGTHLREGDTVAVLHRGARTLHLHAALEGTVEAVNTDLQRQPATLRESPYDEGWLLRLAPRHLAGALRQMTVAEDARVWLQSELIRLRDCVAALQPAHAMTLADGGLPADGFAGELREDEWRRFEQAFFTPAVPRG